MGTGRAKNSARRRCSNQIARVRAGFEPFRVVRHFHRVLNYEWLVRERSHTCRTPRAAQIRRDRSKETGHTVGAPRFSPYLKKPRAIAGARSRFSQPTKESFLAPGLSLAHAGNVLLKFSISLLLKRGQRLLLLRR